MKFFVIKLYLVSSSRLFGPNMFLIISLSKNSELIFIKATFKLSHLFIKNMSE